MAKSIIIHSEQSFWQKFRSVNWGLVILLTLVASVGFLSLYSAAGGSLEPWAIKQIMRFIFGVCVMVGIAMIDIKWWYKLAWPIYIVGFVLLVIVEVMGHIGMGAQRWINLGFMQLQPSELMKVAVIIALARLFHNAGIEKVRFIPYLVIPGTIILAPVGLVLTQPDLGTALMIAMDGTAMIFLAGAPLWLFFGGAIAFACMIPIAWQFLHDYQRQRVWTFLDPERDPLGTGYHITQSKIALGSGGIEGKGFFQGTQSHLNLLPEKQTDFIFTLWAEEWGLMGGVVLLSLFALIFLYGLWISTRCQHDFGRYLAMGITVNFSLYALINVAMVMGLLPVVGIPLPLISYGGTQMLAILSSFGLMMSAYLHRDSKLSRF